MTPIRLKGKLLYTWQVEKDGSGRCISWSGNSCDAEIELPPPPVPKVGDEVLVRGKVIALTDGYEGIVLENGSCHMNSRIVAVVNKNG